MSMLTFLPELRAVSLRIGKGADWTPRNPIASARCNLLGAYTTRSVLVGVRTRERGRTAMLPGDFLSLFAVPPGQFQQNLP